VSGRGFSAIGLCSPKSSLNVGSVLRAAGCFDARLVVVAGSRPDRYMGRIATDTQKSYRHIPTLRVADVFDAIPYDCVPIAVDLVQNARDLRTFSHPERAFYIFGPEDGTLGKAVTDRCKFSVMIPTAYCMNLAATVNVVLYDRMLKRNEQKQMGVA
jgi:tRNA(Leu) C34 or U34 (ribose-2'-O)-methylase TrmL